MANPVPQHNSPTLQSLWNWAKGKFIYLGVPIIALLVLKSFQASQEISFFLDRTTQKQGQVRDLLWVNLLNHRATMLALDANLHHHSAQSKKALGVIDADIKYAQGHLNNTDHVLDDTLTGLHEIRSTIAQLSSNEKTSLVSLLGLSENLGEKLSDQEVTAWYDLLENNESLLANIHRTNRLLSGVYATFVFFLIALLWIDRRRQKAEKNLADQNLKMIATSKMASLGEMAGGIAHEINSPLAAIKNLCGILQEVIEEEPLDKALIKEMAQNAEQTTDRIAKIISGLRSFSRDGSNDPYQCIQLKQLVDETLVLCVERFKNNGTKLLVEDFAQSLNFEGRSTQISQVLVNLLNNSHDAVSTLPEKWVKLTVEEKAEIIEIRVSDSGPGIPHEIQSKIFQPFFTTKDIGKGTGMGLSISLGILKSHQGELQIDPQSKNTCFIVKLPKKQSIRPPVAVETEAA